MFNNISSRSFTTSYVAAECLKEYTCFPLKPFTSSNFFNLSEIWPLLASTVIASFLHNAPYLLAPMNRP
ncbi:MAG: hypothetical protein EZS28_038083, partial [Streblomastix strix]